MLLCNDFTIRNNIVGSMLALLFFFAIIYFLVPLRFFYIKKMKTEGIMVLIFSCFPAFYFYATQTKGEELGLMVGAEVIVIVLALLSLTFRPKIVFFIAYLVNSAIFTAIFMAPMIQYYHETMKYFRGHE
jgi:hypothetical protein